MILRCRTFITHRFSLLLLLLVVTRHAQSAESSLDELHDGLDKSSMSQGDKIVRQAQALMAASTVASSFIPESTTAKTSTTAVKMPPTDAPTLPTTIDASTAPLDTTMPSLRPTRAPSTKLPTIRRKKEYNLLVITADQLRFDTLRVVQDTMQVYNNKLKVRTPNIDRLAKQGVIFETAYAQSSSCAPARATLRSGCTMERHGIQGNDLVRSYQKHAPVLKKVNAIHTYDQILHAQNYQVESYGKWHLVDRWFYDIVANGTTNAVQYDSYALDLEYPTFEGSVLSNGKYPDQASAWAQRDGLVKSKTMAYATATNGQQQQQQYNPRTRWPYTPIQLDPRVNRQKAYGANVGEELDESSIMGIDSLPANVSMTTYTGLQGVLAVRRLAMNPSKPWALTVSFEHPHPPYVAPAEYAKYYLDRQSNLLVPPNIGERIGNDFYAKRQARQWELGYGDALKVQEWTAIYYATVEEVDVWVGEILNELDAQGMTDNTMVVFTADHGEFLGAHGMSGKLGFFEEALRVPLIMRLPSKIKQETVVKRPVSHLDVFPTIMDYLGYASHDDSDGKSLRPAISGSSYRKYYDDEYAVAEVDLEDGFDNLGIYPNFMVRHGNWKLMIAKLAKSETQDMMFNLETDPFETRNLLERDQIGLAWVGKAEHLKCLLLEWLRRNDGDARYYSLPQWNGYEGRGDVQEVLHRRTWGTVDQWVSDATLDFDKPVFSEGAWRSNAWLYIGRTTLGRLRIYEIDLEGFGAEFFTVTQSSAVVLKNGYVRVGVSFVSIIAEVDVSTFEVNVVIKSSADARRAIPISFRR